MVLISLKSSSGRGTQILLLLRPKTNGNIVALLRLYTFHHYFIIWNKFLITDHVSMRKIACDFIGSFVLFLTLFRSFPLASK
jgi:hypothetical protein